MNERTYTVVVIALMCVLGSTAEAQEWTFCAPEGGVCAFTGTMEVRYGANNVFTSRALSGGTACINSVFGDPIFGVIKACDIRPVAVVEGPTTKVVEVVILDKTGKVVGPFFDGDALTFLDGSYITNWNSSDTTPHAHRWIRLDITPNDFSTGTPTTYFEEANCVGQPFLLSQRSWFAKPIIDTSGLAVLADDVVIIRSLRSFLGSNGLCQNIDTRSASISKLVSFPISALGFVPPFTARVIE